MGWHKFVEWFLIGFVGGLGYLTINLIWNLIVKK